jgi:ABC-type lipoprotein release transport system permease subunit
MFFTYVRRELRRRMRQAVFIALGLALGVGLVITVTAASAGVRNAQGTVLHALYGVGTDVTVTKTPKAGSFSPRRGPRPEPRSARARWRQDPRWPRSTPPRSAPCPACETSQRPRAG